MVQVRVEVKTKLLLSEKAPKYKKELLAQLGNDGRLIMESVTPRRTSRGANSYKIIEGADSVEIRNETKYLPWVNDGTGLYGPRHQRITPTHAKYLHFYWKGQEWFLKSVRGQKPRKFVERGAKDIVNAVDKASVIAMNKTFK